MGKPHFMSTHHLSFIACRRLAYCSFMKWTQGILNWNRCDNFEYSNINNYSTWRKERNHSFVTTAVLERDLLILKLQWFVKGRCCCDICDYSCYQKSYMNKHVASVHERKKSFKCEICDYSCSQKSYMNKHVASVHEEKNPIKCDLCNFGCFLTQQM